MNNYVILCKHIIHLHIQWFIYIYIYIYIYRFPKNETLNKKWIVNMKRLEKDIKTKFIPGPAATMCTSHYVEQYIFRRL